jgi:hypothetical protein
MNGDVSYVIYCETSAVFFTQQTALAYATFPLARMAVDRAVEAGTHVVLMRAGLFRDATGLDYR